MNPERGLHGHWLAPKLCGFKAILLHGLEYTFVNTQRDRSQFLPSAFSSAALPAIGDGTGLGNVRIGPARGPRADTYDMAFSKTTPPVRGITEQGTLMFRSEFFNAFNHPQYSNPGTAVGTVSFGVIPTASVAPRMIQFAMKYTF
jgi:hypothetical protein